MKLKKLLILPLCSIALASCSSVGFKEEYESKPTSDIDEYLENINETYNYSYNKIFEKTINYDDAYNLDYNYLTNGLLLYTDSDNKSTATSMFINKELFSGINYDNITVSKNDINGFNIVIKTENDKYYLIDPYGNKTKEYDNNITNIEVSYYNDKIKTLYGNNDIDKIMLSYRVNDITYKYLYNDYKLEEFVDNNYYQNKDHEEYDMSIYGYEDTTLIIDKRTNGYKATYKVLGKEDKVYTLNTSGLGGIIGNTVIFHGDEAVTQYDDYNSIKSDAKGNPLYLKSYIQKLNLKTGKITKEYSKIIPTRIKFISKDLYSVQIKYVDKDYTYTKTILTDDDFDLENSKVNDYNFDISANSKFTYTKVNENYYNDTNKYLIDKKSNVITTFNEFKDVDLIDDLNLFVCKNENNLYGVIDSNGKVLTDFIYTDFKDDFKFGYLYLKGTDKNWYQINNEGNITNLNTTTLDNYYYHDSNNHIKTLLNNDLGEFDVMDIISSNYNYYDQNNIYKYYVYVSTGNITEDVTKSKLFIYCNLYKKEAK